MTTAPGTNESVTAVARHTSPVPVRGKVPVKSQPSGAMSGFIPNIDFDQSRSHSLPDAVSLV